MTSFRPSEFFSPKSLEEAIDLLVKYGKGARIIAGGTDLLVQRPPETESLIDISCLGLAYLHSDEGGLHIGAATTLRTLEVSPLFSGGPYQVLGEAVRALATPTIRNRATIGGNLSNASPAADLPPALMVLDAVVEVAGRSEGRILKMEDFFSGVKKTSLREGELLKAIHLPAPPERWGAAFWKLRHHPYSIDIAIVNAAAGLSFEKAICKKARIALGAVAPTPVFAGKAQEMLEGGKIDQQRIREAARAASEEARPIDDIRASAQYRKKMVAVAVQRALTESARRSGIWN
jgi:carbon-monoxide dehydrogenase medium subunit